MRILHLLPPANEVWGKVIFLHLSVILFIGGVPGQVHPPGQVLLWAGTPPGRCTQCRYTPRQVHPQAGKPPLGRYTPQAGTPPGRYTSQQCMLGYGQQAGSTDPAGMHSCFINLCNSLKKNSNTDIIKSVGRTYNKNTLLQIFFISGKYIEVFDSADQDSHMDNSNEHCIYETEQESSAYSKRGTSLYEIEIIPGTGSH